jgi:hypothetical protein
MFKYAWDMLVWYALHPVSDFGWVTLTLISLTSFGAGLLAVWL